MLKNFIGSRSWKYMWVLALGLLTSGGASAITITDVPCSATVPPGCWEIGTPSSLVEIPVGTWQKNLAGATQPAGVFTKILTENLILTQASLHSLKSWTETIVTAVAGDWVWDSGTFECFNATAAACAFSPYTVPGTGGTISADGLTITFGLFTPALDPNFDLDPGVGVTLVGDIEILITKTLHCVRAGGTGNERCDDDFMVIENAVVPVPGTLLLLAGGLAGLAGLRRRRYAQK